MPPVTHKLFCSHSSGNAIFVVSASVKHWITYEADEIESTENTAPGDIEHTAEKSIYRKTQELVSVSITLCNNTQYHQ